MSEDRKSLVGWSVTFAILIGAIAILLLFTGCATTGSVDVAGVHRASERGQRGEAPQSVLYFPMVNFGDPSWLSDIAEAGATVGVAVVDPTLGIVEASIDGAGDMLKTARPQQSRDLVIEIDGLAATMTAVGVKTSAELTTIDSLAFTFSPDGWTALEKPEGGEPEPVPPTE